MKPKWLASLNAGKLILMFHGVKLSVTVLLLFFILLAVSCDKNDDIETIRQESSIDNESPDDDGSETDEDSQNEDKPIFVHTDPEPDLSFENKKYLFNLDLNNDGIIDFTLSLFSDTTEWLLISSNSNAKNGIISVAPWYAHPALLNAGQEIFNLRGYRDGEFYEIWSVFNLGRCFGGDPVCPYDWKNKVDKHLGLRFNIKGKTHYGWARIDVSSPTQWIIKDYAYNATPNSAILAGQVE